MGQKTSEEGDIGEAITVTTQSSPLQPPTLLLIISVTLSLSQREMVAARL